MSDTKKDLFQRLSLDESIRRTFSIYCRGFLPFTKIATAVFAVTQTVWIVLLPLLAVALGVSSSEFSDPEYLKDHIGAYLVLFSVNVVLSTVIGAVGEGTMIKAVADIYQQREPDFVACIRFGARNTCALLSASFLVLIGVCTGFFLFFFPGLYLSVTWFLVSPVIVVEGCSNFASLKRSKILVSGSWCYTFCTFLIVYIFMVFVQIAWGAMFTGGNDASHTTLSVWGSLVAAIPTVAWRPIIAIMKTIMYINLRVEKEGLNAEIFACDLGERGGDLSYRQIPLLGEEKDNIFSDI